MTTPLPPLTDAQIREYLADLRTCLVTLLSTLHKDHRLTTKEFNTLFNLLGRF